MYAVGSAFFLAGGLLDLVRCRAESGPSRSRVAMLVLYLFGGSFYVLGSVLFWPSFGIPLAGIWIFRIGGVAYFSGSALLIYSLPIRKPRYVIATSLYMLGSTLFLCGGVASEFGGASVDILATIWTIGSFSFTIGATIGLVNYVIDWRPAEILADENPLNEMIDENESMSKFDDDSKNTV